VRRSTTCCGVGAALALQSNLRGDSNPLLSRCDPGLISTACLSLKTANTIAAAVVEAAVRNSFKPITVTIVDPAGNIIVVQRMDGCAPGAFPEYSLAKARAAVYLLMPSRDFRDRYTPVGTSKPQDFSKLSQLFAMVEISGSQIAPFPGGVLLRDKNGTVVGAIGVSGSAGDEDEYCALQGVKAVSALQLTSEPAQHSCATVKDR